MTPRRIVVLRHLIPAWPAGNASLNQHFGHPDFLVGLQRGRSVVHGARVEQRQLRICVAAGGRLGLDIESALGSDTIGVSHPYRFRLDIFGFYSRRSRRRFALCERDD